MIIVMVIVLLFYKDMGKEIKSAVMIFFVAQDSARTINLFSKY